MTAALLRAPVAKRTEWPWVVTVVCWCHYLVHYLELGTNLLVDAFLQDKSWSDDLMAAVHQSGARLLLVGVHCADAALLQREQKRGDRPNGQCPAAPSPTPCRFPGFLCGMVQLVWPFPHHGDMILTPAAPMLCAPTLP